MLIKYLSIFFLQECHVDEAGCYTDDVGKRFAGLNVLTEANDKGFEWETIAAATVLALKNAPY